MTIDISQFHGVFFEESFEGLEVMESELLELDASSPDVESINNIFRAAHSIKGGSGSFGFNDVTNFTHVLETLLDEVRSDKHKLNQDEVNLLLSSVDCLREMLTAARDGTDVDEAQVKSIHDELERALSNECVTETETETEAKTKTKTETEEHAVVKNESEVLAAALEWHIHFAPHLHLFQTGNDPLRMFRELEELGALTSTANISKLPPFNKYDAEECYLSWDLVLLTEAKAEKIKEVFEWVEDDCELSIEQGNQQETSNVVNVIADNATPIIEDVDVNKVVPVAEKKKDADKKAGASNETTSIRVNISKVDALINMVGELVITQSMLSQFGEEFDMNNIEKLSEGLKQLERNTRELQENVMQIRMLPISFSFNRFPRLVHDLSNKLGKKIELKLSGEATELDKTVMEKIGDPLVHLVRNSIDHGIEMPDERLAAGKPETGTLNLNAYHEVYVVKTFWTGSGLI